MATQIHGFGPNGELSPGAEAALEGLGGGGGGSTTVQIGTVTLPASPAQGQSVSVLADSETVLPEGVTWDSGGEPTVADRLLISFVWSGTDWVGTYGLPIPADPVPPDETAPSVPTGLTATATSHTTVDLEWVASTDAVGVTGYEYRVDGGAAVDAGAGTTETVGGLTAETEYDFEVRAYDEAGNRSDWSTPATETTDAAPGDSTPPTPGTLAASSITDTSFTLTVTGASDETALHSQPYRFSTDNGATYSAWQTSAVFNATELDAETEYDCVHQVRDAALNVATGTAIPVETSEASSGLLTFLDTASFSSGGVTHTFTAIPFGDASTNRHIVVAIGARAGAAGRSIVGVTVGGVAATLSGVAFTDLNVMDVAVAHVPTGTSGDVVVTYSSGGAIRSVIGVWAADAAVDVSSAAIDHGTSTASAGPVTIPAGGAGVAIAIEANVVPDSYEIPTFTGGVTLDESITVGSYYAGAFGSTEIAGSATATVSGTDNASLLFVALEQTL